MCINFRVRVANEEQKVENRVRVARKAKLKKE